MKKLFTLLLLTLFFYNGFYSQNIIYVNANATGANTGSSWSNAYRSLEDAINTSRSGDEIWVKSDSYRPLVAGTSFIMKEGVKILGGFPSSVSDPTIYDRDWENNPTILLGSGSAVIYNKYDYLSPLGTDAILDGFYITEGIGTYSPMGDLSGGGICNEYASPTIQNCYIFNCSAVYGGGIFNHYSSPEIKNCIIEKCRAELGGGIVNEKESYSKIFNSYFLANEAYSGGGIFNFEDSGLSLNNSVMQHNIAHETGGAIYLALGREVELTNALITGNYAADMGGGIYAKDYEKVRMTNITLSRNHAENLGGGICYGNHTDIDSYFEVRNSIIWGNHASNATTNMEHNVLYMNPSSQSIALYQYSLVEYSMDGSAYWNTPIGTDGGRNIDEDPLFVDYPYNSSAPTFEGDFHLQCASGALNAGNNLFNNLGTDLEGSTRIVGTSIDIGVYERQPANDILYVNAALGSNGDGSSWSGAYNNLTDALDYARNNHLCVSEIWVAEGAYRPILNASFEMVDRIAIYGGFSGTETSLNQRDYESNITILQGSGSAVIYNNFTSALPLSRQAILDGFTITGGNGASGGGMINIYSSPTIRNCIIKSNTGNSGGGIYNQNYSSPYLYNVEIINNVGSGIFNTDYCSPILTDVVITGNMGLSNGGGMWNRLNSSPVLTNVKINENTSTGHGGAMYNNFESSPVLTNVEMIGNTAGYGGGMYNLYACSPELNNVLITGNSVTYSGSAICNNRAAPICINVTISGNYSRLNGVITNFAQTYDSLIEAHFVNCIIWGNKTGNGTIAGIVNQSAQCIPSYSHCIVEGWNSSGSSFGSGTNIIDADPLFVDYQCAALNIPTINGNFRLQSCSPAINTGVNHNYFNTDMDDLPRIYGEIIDMGAYEAQFLRLERLYVNWQTPNPLDGSSWNTAFANLSDALDFARENSCVKEIWVAQGTYQPAVNNSFSMIEGVKIYGGFSAGDTSLSDQNRDIKVTVLEGNGRSVIYNVDNDLTYEALLDGFYIRNGTGVLVSGYTNTDYGGGILNINVSPCINNCVIEYCTSTAGAGIGNSNSNARYTNLIIRNNTGIYDGGGIHVGGNSGTNGGIYENILFENNVITQRAGGGLMNHGPTIILKNCIFRGNKAVRGGGIFATGTVNCQYENLLITGNVATNSGGGIFNENCRNFSLVNITISGNYAQNEGGGWSHKNSGSNPYNEAKMYNSIIWGNRISSGNNNVYFRVQANNHLNLGWNLIDGLDNLPAYTDYGGNITGDPMFVDFRYATLQNPVTSGNFRLNCGSIAMNSGQNSMSTTNTDLDGNDRILNEIIDMGPYEIQSISAERLYVNCRTQDSSDGSSWNTAFADFADALDFARENSCIREIWVAQGTYMPDENSSFKMVSNVKIYGGFLGVETQLSQRDFGQYVTILQGNGKSVINNDFTENEPLLNALIDGFTLKNGSGSDIYYPYDNLTYVVGGGIRNSYSNIEIHNCIIRECSAIMGGGVFNFFSGVTIKNTTICENTAQRYGGGIYDYESGLNVDSCYIERNIALIYGGGISLCDNLTGLQTIIKNSIINRNNSSGYGGGFYIGGLGVDYCVYMENVEICDNHVTVSAGYSMGGGIYSHATVLDFKNVKIFGNSSLQGGGIFLECSYSSRFTKLENVLISGNKAGQGGGLHTLSHSGNMSIINSTISGNHSTYRGGGIYFGNGNINQITVFNSIIWGNNSGESFSISNITENQIDITYKNCLIQNSGGSGSTWDNNIGTDGGNNIDADPLFVDYRYATEQSATTEGDFRLQCASEAINAGLNGINSSNTDLDGNDRIYEGTIDMGAYENIRHIEVIYVNCNNSNPNGDGSSWANAFRNLEQALSIAEPSSCGTEIWVAQGTYYSPYNHYVMVDKVAIYGGFLGNETSLEQRDFQNNTTILSGAQSQMRYVFFNQFTSNNPLSRKAILDGFTLRDGRGLYWTFDSPYSGISGGAMFNEYASPTIINCTFTNNIGEIGSAMHNRYSNPLVINSKFHENSAGLATIYNIYSSPDFFNVEITGNYTSGMFNYNSNSKLINVLIAGNVGDYGKCAGIHNAYNSDVILFNTTIAGNFSSGDFDIESGGLYNSDNSTSHIFNSIIWGNLSFYHDGTQYVTFVRNIINATGCSSPAYYSLIEGLANLNLPGSNNMDANPIFLNYSPAYYYGISLSGNYNLNTNSPAINAGSNVYFIDIWGRLVESIRNEIGNRYVNEWGLSNYVDFDYNNRIIGGTIDMGAYESSIIGPPSIMNENINSEYLSDSEFKVYPNPVSDIMKIEYEALNGDEKIFVIDALGKIIMESKLTSDNTELDVSFLNPGIYFVKVISGSKISTTKVIKK